MVGLHDKGAVISCADGCNCKVDTRSIHRRGGVDRWLAGRREREAGRIDKEIRVLCWLYRSERTVNPGWSVGLSYGLQPLTCSIYTIDEKNMFYVFYVAAKATYIRLPLWQNGGFFGPSSVKKGRTKIVFGWNMSGASTSTYPENLGSGGQLPAELRGRVCLFLSVFLFVRHATLIGTESPDYTYTYWTWGERA